MAAQHSCQDCAAPPTTPQTLHKSSLTLPLLPLQDLHSPPSPRHCTLLPLLLPLPQYSRERNQQLKPTRQVSHCPSTTAYPALVLLIAVSLTNTCNPRQTERAILVAMAITAKLFAKKNIYMASTTATSGNSKYATQAAVCDYASLLALPWHR